MLQTLEVRERLAKLFANFQIVTGDPQRLFHDTDRFGKQPYHGMRVGVAQRCVAVADLT
ncbi:hypothetical protein D3C76_1625140 [compost metagenome]